MIGNVVLKKDGGGRAMLDKAKSTERIDGISALADAMIEWISDNAPTGDSKYEDGEMMVL